MFQKVGYLTSFGFFQTLSFLENEFVHDHSEIVRKLSGYTNDLKSLLSNPNDSNLALWFFDNYVAKAAE